MIYYPQYYQVAPVQDCATAMS